MSLPALVRLYDPNPDNNKLVARILLPDPSWKELPVVSPYKTSFEMLGPVDKK